MSVDEMSTGKIYREEISEYNMLVDMSCDL
jgi:hypothetical protein